MQQEKQISAELSQFAFPGDGLLPASAEVPDIGSLACAWAIILSAPNSVGICGKATLSSDECSEASEVSSYLCLSK